MEFFNEQQYIFKSWFSSLQIWPLFSCHFKSNECHIFKIIWTCMRNSFRRCGGPLTRRSKNLYENVLTFPDIFNLFHVSSDTCTCKIYFKSFLIEFQRVFTISFWNQCVKISNLSVYLRCIHVLRRKHKRKRWCGTKPHFFLSVYN